MLPTAVVFGDGSYKKTWAFLSFPLFELVQEFCGLICVSQVCQADIKKNKKSAFLRSVK